MSGKNKRVVISLARMAVSLTVVGSINLDLVTRVDRIPRVGETVGGGELFRFPGGKGANQAVAAARLGAEVRMIGAVGADVFAEEALAGLHEAGVELELERHGATGLAVIIVDAAGENQIVTVPGANAEVAPRAVEGAVLCQLEVSDAVVAAAAASASFFALNAAPARPIGIEPDLLVVNQLEYEVVSRGRLVAVTYGAEGAALYEGGREIARAVSPAVEAVDGTAAGDAFTACLLVSLLEGRSREEALRRACTAGALAASRLGAQPSLPTAAEIDKLLAV
jgi:ribokinase